jgi:CPA2 family monovalent cation:H+ antiporter-2
MPIRDFFGGLFFVFFGLQVDPSSLPPVLVPAILLALVGAATKAGTGWWAARRSGIGARGRVRAGLSLIPRGEFSIVIAGLAVAAGIPDVGPVATGYVLLLAVSRPVLTRFVEPLTARFVRPAVPG